MLASLITQIFECLNIPHDEGLSFLKDYLDGRVDKTSKQTFSKLVLNKIIFEFSDRTYKQKRRIAIQDFLQQMQIFQGRINAKIFK